METVLFVYEYALKYEKNTMHFWSRAPSEISSCPSVKSTVLYCEKGDVKRCDVQAFRANLLSVL